MSMENNITFTGIKNIYTGKKIYSTLGSYLNPNGALKQGTKYYEEYRIKCKLTDDNTGKDLSEFWDALGKSSDSYQARCLMQTSRDELVLNVKRFEIKDEISPISNSNFTLNNISIMPNQREVLPLFSYLAKLTRKLKNLPEISDDRKNLLDKANLSIHEEAVRFIENM